MSRLHTADEDLAAACDVHSTDRDRLSAWFRYEIRKWRDAVKRHILTIGSLEYRFRVPVAEQIRLEDLGQTRTIKPMSKTEDH